MHSSQKIRYIAVTGVLSAISVVLMLFLEFPLPFFPFFLQFDFSDLPALIGGFALGPISGLSIELVKNLVHLTKSMTGGVGELANFLVGCALVLPPSLFYKYKRTRAGAGLGMAMGTVSMAVVGGFVNYFITIPIYSKLFMPIEAIMAACAEFIPSIDSVPKMVLLTFVPFNVMKGTVISLITFFVYKPLSPILKKNKFYA